RSAAGTVASRFRTPRARRRSRVWRHQVVELLPLTVRVTEYQMAVRRCPASGKRTRADLPPGVPRRPFRPRLTPVVPLLSGRDRLSRREVRQPLQDLWQVRVSIGALWHRFRAGEFDRQELQRRLIPLQARLGRLLRRGQETPDRKAVVLCRELTKWWPA